MCYINYDSQLTAYKTSSIYSNSASNLPCLLCSRLCFWSNLQKPDILSFLSHSDHEQTSNIQPIFEGSGFYTSLNVCVTGPCSVCRSGSARERLQGYRGVVGDQRYVSCLSKRHAMLPYFSSLLLCAILLSVRSALQKESALQSLRRPRSSRATGANTKTHQIRNAALDQQQ